MQSIHFFPFSTSGCVLKKESTKWSVSKDCRTLEAMLFLLFVLCGVSEERVNVCVLSEGV